MDDSSPLDRLRALIAGDEALQDRLAVFEDRDAFAAAAAEIAVVHGIALTSTAIVQQVTPDPLGLDRFDTRPPDFAGWPGRRWLPVAVQQTQGGLAVDWRHFGALRLDAPFYEESARSAQRHPLNALLRLRTPIATLLAPPPADAAGAPDALIFHMSRCGSTLVSQMIAAMPGSVMVSEAAPLDTTVQLVMLNPNVALEERVGLLRGMAAALGRDRFGDRQRFVIKLDSWHSLALPLFRAAFPDTPWLFLFRDPVEVMVSQVRDRGIQTVPLVLPESIYGIVDPHSYSAEEFIAQVLARVNAAAIAHAATGHALFVDYADLPGALETRILPHFGIAADAVALDRAHATIANNAKAPRSPFASDAEEKRRAASDAARAAAATHLDDLHRQLTALAAR